MESICNKCGNYDPQRRTCTLSHDIVKALFNKKCSGFIRYMNLIVESGTESRRYILVSTLRGIERAIPAYDGLDLSSKQNENGMVDRIFTFQGQREIIYEYGARIAAEMAAERNINLQLLPQEADATGDPNKIRSFFENKRLPETNKSLYWMSDTPVEVWT